MTDDKIIEKLKAAILNDMYLEDVRSEDLTADTALFGDGLGLDSLDAVELVVVVEKYFGVSIKDTEEARKAFSTLGVLAEFIKSRLSA